MGARDVTRPRVPERRSPSGTPRRAHKLQIAGFRLPSLSRVQCRAIPDEGVERIGERAARPSVTASTLQVLWCNLGPYGPSTSWQALHGRGLRGVGG